MAQLEEALSSCRCRLRHPGLHHLHPRPSTNSPRSRLPVAARVDHRYSYRLRRVPVWKSFWFEFSRSGVHGARSVRRRLENFEWQTTLAFEFRFLERYWWRLWVFLRGKNVFKTIFSMEINSQMISGKSSRKKFTRYVPANVICRVLAGNTTQWLVGKSIGLSLCRRGDTTVSLKFFPRLKLKAIVIRSEWTGERIQRSRYRKTFTNDTQGNFRAS